MDILTAAALNTMAANVFDFDDTHFPTIIHHTAERTRQSRHPGSAWRETRASPRVW
jgi:hypothetical protein